MVTLRAGTAGRVFRLWGGRFYTMRGARMWDCTSLTWAPVIQRAENPCSVSLTGGEVLNDLLLTDANLGEPLEDFIHAEGGALACDRKPETMERKGKVKEIACLWFFTTMPALSTSVTEWGVTRQGLLNKCPGGWIYSQYGSANKKGGYIYTLVFRCHACSLSSIPVQWVSPCCAPVGPVGHTLLSVREIRGRVSTQSHGEVSLMWQGMRGLCSRRVMSSSWDWSSCDQDGQVFLTCFQGDADEFWDARHNSKCNSPFTPKSVMNKP